MTLYQTDLIYNNNATIYSLLFYIIIMTIKISKSGIVVFHLVIIK